MIRSSQQKPKRTGLRRLIPTWRMTLAGFVVFVLLGAGLFGLGIALVKVPDAHATVTAQSNTWLYADGSVITRTGQVNRQNVGLDKISPAAQHAALAAEDRKFYQEGAVNPQALLRAAWNSATGKGAQGGSTITQQYVKNTYLTQKRTLTRKVKELFISVKVDATQSKDDILDGYLNTSFYGRGAYGIQAAAQAYFGVDASQLDPAQSAYLAALLDAPSAFDMYNITPAHKKAALDRWNYVLDGMVKENWLSAADRAAIKFPDVKEPQGALSMAGQAGYLVQAATDYLTQNHVVSDAELAQGGYTIKLSVDPKREQQLQDAVQQQLTANLDPKSSKVDAAAQAGAVSIDPKTGAVVAMYGGADAVKHWRNNATRHDYQVGSTFKPIALTAALESGARTQWGQKISANTVYDGTSGRPVRGAKGTPYAPPNEGDKNYGSITVQQATDWSVNSAYAQLAQDAGLKNVADTAVKLGLPADTPELSAVPATVLGVSTPSVLDMAGVYATLDNDGQQITPWIVKSVDHEGQAVALPEHKATQAVSASTAQNVTQILEGVISDPGGTGYRAAALNRPAAGKTGTTDDSKSVYFIGYTPDLVTSVALFGQQPGTGAQVSLNGVGGAGQAAGGKFPAMIWTAYMKAALDGTSPSDFSGVAADGPGPVTAPTATASPSATATPSATPSVPTVPTPTPTPTLMPTGTPTASPSPTHTHTHNPTPTPTWSLPPNPGPSGAAPQGSQP